MYEFNRDEADVVNRMASLVKVFFDTGVVVVSCWWFRIERRCSPKRSLSWRLVSPMYWTWHLLHSIRYIRFLDWRDMEWVIFLASLVVKKSIVCLTSDESQIRHLCRLVNVICKTRDKGQQEKSRISCRGRDKETADRQKLSKQC